MSAALEADEMSRHTRKSLAKGKRPKAKLGLPDLDHSKSAVLDSLRSRESKRGYRHAIDEFIQWYCSDPRLSFNKIVVTRYRIFLENRGLAAASSLSLAHSGNRALLVLFFAPPQILLLTTDYGLAERRVAVQWSEQGNTGVRHSRTPWIPIWLSLFRR